MVNSSLHVEMEKEAEIRGSLAHQVQSEADTISVFVDCSHAIIRAGLELALRELGFVGAATPAADIAVRDLQGDIRTGPRSEIPTLALVDNVDSAVRALRQGYLGYLTPDASIEDLGRAARVIRRGEHWAERRVLLIALTETSSDEQGTVDNRLGRLTRREHEVLQFVLRGLTNVVIANELGISPKTVKGHVSSIYGKLLVRDRKELLIALS